MYEILARDLLKNLPQEIRDKYLSFLDLPRKYQYTLAGDEIYCLIDFESTGFDPARDRIIEVAMIRARGDEVLERENTFIDPGIPIPTYIRDYTGITDAMVAGAPIMDEYFPIMRSFLADHPVVAFSSFEKRFFEDLYRRFAKEEFGNIYIDAMDLAMMLLPSLRSHRQVDLAGFWSLEVKEAHRAYDDVGVLFNLYQVLLNGLYSMPLELLETLVTHSASSEPGFVHLLVEVIKGRVGETGVEKLRLENIIKRDDGWGEIPRLSGTTGAVVVAAGEVEEFFATGGAISHQYELYEVRAEQIEMAEAVRGALERGEVLMVEAGTGTGKSLAYLVPGALRAQRSKKPLVVSTKTLNLQDQLFARDLPLLSRAIQGEIRYSVLKGYSNYICLRKLQSLVDSDRKLNERQLPVLGMLLNWISENTEGDLSLLNLGRHRGLFPLVAADFRDCMKDRCRFGRGGECFYRRAYRRAERSHVVVVNHSLLLTGTGLEPEALVVDEAHTLEDVATEQLAAKFERGAIFNFLDFLSDSGGGGYLSNLISSLISRLEPGQRTRGAAEVEAAQADVSDCRAAADRFFQALRELNPVEEGNRRTKDFRITQYLRGKEAYLALEEASKPLRSKLISIAAHLNGIVSLAKASEASDDAMEGTLVDIEGNIARATEFLEVLDFVVAGEQSDFVYWATVSNVPSRGEALKASPLDVGPALCEMIYSPVNAVVLTSATLTVGDDFSFIASRIGTELLEPERRRVLRLDSSFDFKEQMQILVISDMPAPNDPDYQVELVPLLVEAITAVKGGALALFTNKKLMEEVHQGVYPELERAGLKVLCQLPGYSRRYITEEFIADLTTSLFGTSSFWEGVDARGETLKLVVVTRLPFESPRKPVFEARCERLKLEGLNDFKLYSVPLAALRLKQGVGRLIRTARDRGQVLIGDSRVVSKGYGSIMLRSLPPAKVRRITRGELAGALKEFEARSSNQVSQP